MKKLLLAPICLVLFGLVAVAQEVSDQPVVSKTANQKYAPLPNVPGCATLAVLRGDPSKGASVVEIKFTPGCIVPWHWHTAAESTIPLSGLLEITMKDARPFILANGDFGYLPANHIHQAKCTGSRPCAAVFLIDAAFDIHYVDKSGAEIPADTALAEAEKLMNKKSSKPTR
ncbi:MAG TPA: cupin domain-containing protein [Candidatus Eisenbacteria bacterium]|nr:cupin domain-containing protein [Candidatus Eisenbacteria bacterium]